MEVDTPQDPDPWYRHFSQGQQIMRKRLTDPADTFPFFCEDASCWQIHPAVLLEEEDFCQQAKGVEGYWDVLEVVAHAFPAPQAGFKRIIMVRRGSKDVLLLESVSRHRHASIREMRLCENTCHLRQDEHTTLSKGLLCDLDQSTSSFAREAAIVACCSFLVERGIAPGFPWFDGFLTRGLHHKGDLLRESLLFMSQGLTTVHHFLSGENDRIELWQPLRLLSPHNKFPGFAPLCAILFQMLFSYRKAWDTIGFATSDAKTDNVVFGIKHLPLEARNHRWHFQTTASNGKTYRASIPPSLLTMIIDMGSARVDQPPAELFASLDAPVPPLSSVSTPGMLLRGECNSLPSSLLRHEGYTRWEDMMARPMDGFFCFVRHHLFTLLEEFGLGDLLTPEDVVPVDCWDTCVRMMRDEERKDAYLDCAERSTTSFFLHMMHMLACNYRELRRCTPNEEVTEYLGDLEELLANTLLSCPQALLGVLWKRYTRQGNWVSSYRDMQRVFAGTDRALPDIPCPFFKSSDATPSVNITGEFVLAYLYPALCPNPFTIEDATASNLFLFLCEQTEKAYPVVQDVPPSLHSSYELELAQ